MTQVEIRILGQPSLTIEGKAKALPRKSLAILSVLCLDGSHTREYLAALLWDCEHRLARQSLRVALLELRRALSPYAAVLQGSGEQLGLVAGEDLWVDAWHLQKSGAQELAALWRGPLLEGLNIRDSAAWDDWLAQQEAALSLLHLERCLLLGQRALQAGEADLAATLAAKALRVTPHNEQALHLLIAGQYAAGKEGVAQLSIDQFRHQFQKEYGSAPQLESLNLLPVPLQPSVPSSSLPAVSLTPLIGRDTERKTLQDILRTSRLVTVHGLAGIGKTRLAFQVAHDLGLAWPEFLIRVVSLEEVRDLANFLPSLAKAVGVTRQGSGLLEEISFVLAGRPALLVLDNAEHLHGVGQTCSVLLAACPTLRLLVTSREVLGLHSEHIFTLDGLEIPDAGSSALQASATGAVRLFEDRARQVDASFVAGPVLDDVSQVCRLLGGIPLGLEFAAARTRYQTVSEIRHELTAALLDLGSPHLDTPRRHRSLRVALQQSYLGLSEETQATFEALGIFPASFTLNAALEVTGTSADHLAELMDHALLQRDLAGRYQFHPLVRALATEKLAQHPQRHHDLQVQHTAFYRQALLRLDLQSSGRVNPPVLDFLQTEEAHVLALTEHLLSHGPVTELREVAEPLLLHFALRRHPQQARQVCRQVIAGLRPYGKAAYLALAAFLYMQGWLEYFYGNLHEAQRAHEKAVRYAGRTDDPLERSRTLGGLSEVQSQLGHLSQAVASGQAAVEASAPLNPARRYRMLTVLGTAWMYLGNHEEAVSAYAKAQALDEMGHVDSPLDVIVCLTGLGASQMMAGQTGTALATFAKANRTAQWVGSHGQRAGILVLTAMTYAIDGSLESEIQAEKNLTEVRGLISQSHSPWIGCQIAHVEARLALGRGNLDAAAQHCAEAFREGWSSGNVSITFWMLPVYARLLVAQGNLPRAAEIIGLLLYHPASNRWTRDQAQALREEICFLDGESQAAMERGAQLCVPELFSGALP